MGRGHGGRQAGRRRRGREVTSGQFVAQGRFAARSDRRARGQGRAHRAGAQRVRRLVMWDIDYTLLRGGGVAMTAWQSAFTEVTGLAWRQTPMLGGRTDLDICAEVFAVHGVTGCTPEAFFVRYVAEVERLAHLFAEQGAVMPGVRDVLARLQTEPGVVQTLVTGNVPEVARAKVAAFGLAGAFDTEVGGYGTDDSLR